MTFWELNQSLVSDEVNLDAGGEIFTSCLSRPPPNRSNGSPGACTGARMRRHHFAPLTQRGEQLQACLFVGLVDGGLFHGTLIVVGKVAAARSGYRYGTAEISEGSRLPRH